MRKGGGNGTKATKMLGMLLKFSFFLDLRFAKDLGKMG